MNVNIEKGKIEFDDGNYDEALTYFGEVDSNDDDYEFAQLFVANCLMELERFSDSLEVIDGMVSRDPSNGLAWFNMALCQIFLKEDEAALQALGNVVGLIDMSSKHELVLVAKLYRMLGMYDEALKFCNLALEIDGNYKYALYEKSFVGLELEDDEIIRDVSDRFVGLLGDGSVGLTSVFLVKLFSKMYGDCMNLIENAGSDELDADHIVMLKAILYKQICEDRAVQLLIVNSQEFSLDDALAAMLDFVEEGKDNGKIDGVQYYII